MKDLITPLLASAATITTAEVTDFINLDAIQSTVVLAATTLATWLVNKGFSWLRNKLKRKAE